MKWSRCSERNGAEQSASRAMAVAAAAAALGERVGVRTALAEVDDGGGERVVHRDVRRVLEERHAAQLRVVVVPAAPTRADRLHAELARQHQVPHPVHHQVHAHAICTRILVFSYSRILLNSRMRLLYECALSVTHQLSTISHIHMWTHSPNLCDTTIASASGSRHWYEYWLCMSILLRNAVWVGCVYERFTSIGVRMNNTRPKEKYELRLWFSGLMWLRQVCRILPTRYNKSASGVTACQPILISCNIRSKSLKEYFHYDG